jgi:Putative Actinobacterial Holin-X, holin superfamily III
MQSSNEIIDPQRDGSEAEWPALVSRAINDLSRILHAEIRLAELGIKNLIQEQTDRAVKITLALVLFLLAAVCSVGAAVIGLHELMGLWWAAFAVVAGVSGLGGTGLFLWAKRREKETVP